MEKKNEVARKGFSKTIWFWVIAISIGVSLNFGFMLSMIDMTFKNLLNEEMLRKSLIWGFSSFYFLIFWFIMAYVHVGKLYIKELEK